MEFTLNKPQSANSFFLMDPSKSAVLYLLIDSFPKISNTGRLQKGEKSKIVLVSFS